MSNFMRAILITVLMFSGFGISFAQTSPVTSVANTLKPAITISSKATNDNVSPVTKPTAFDKDAVTRFFTLLAVVVGAVLGVGIDFFRKKLEVRRIKKAIVQELEDCRAWLLRNKFTVEHLIQLSFLKQEISSRPVPVPTHVYANHYASVAIYFNKHERVSINAIHNLIRYAEKQAEQLEELIRKSLSNAADENNAETMRALLVGLYSNINLAIVHISNHLANKESLNVIGFGGNLEAVEQDEAGRIRELITEAKLLGPDGLRAKHYKT